MKTVVIASQKGGAGKSTLAAHLAVQAVHGGNSDVVLIDTDPQGSLTKWHELREAEVPGRVEVEFAQIPAGLELLRQCGTDLVIIDTAPNRSNENKLVFELADLVLIPVRASPADLWAVGATVDQLKSSNIPFLFVLNAVKASALITGQAAAALSHHGRVAHTFIADRTVYASAMVNGLTAQELLPRSPAAKEVASLYANMHACLHANIKE